eukprot:s185_g20.t1
MAKKDVASFPRADTDIIKSEDMITALPVPRSSSEVIKPSELFLDLMMLDPLKTKEVSETPAKPSTALRAEASPKHLPPASAPPVTQPAIASALQPAQGPSLASQMVANATAATASMPLCQAAPFYSIPEGPRMQKILSWRWPNIDVSICHFYLLASESQGANPRSSKSFADMALLLISSLILAVHGSEIQVVYNDYSFAMVNLASGLGECWGDSRFGGDCSSVNFTGVTKVSANARSMAALTSSGGVCWGPGGLSNGGHSDRF